MVSRADVAAVMAEAVVRRSTVRFLLCNKLGPATPSSDPSALLEAAEWPWQQRAAAAAPMAAHMA